MTDIHIISGSGNIFADLGIENPVEAKLKARLASRIQTTIEASGWTQTRAAEVLGLKQADVSNLVRGRLDGFSIERLFKLLSRLEYDVKVVVSRHQYVVEEIQFGESRKSAEIEVESPTASTSYEADWFESNFNPLVDSMGVPPYDIVQTASGDVELAA